MDIFDRDYLFIPIHDALHWSLIVVCHPGELAHYSSSSSSSKAGDGDDDGVGGGSGGRAGGGGGGDSSSGEEDGADGTGTVDEVVSQQTQGQRRKPCILHLDSMNGE